MSCLKIILPDSKIVTYSELSVINIISRDAESVFSPKEEKNEGIVGQSKGDWTRRITRDHSSDRKEGSGESVCSTQRKYEDWPLTFLDEGSC